VSENQKSERVAERGFAERERSGERISKK